MDEENDDGVIPHLKCDVELGITGPNFASINKWAADALRKLADSIEKDELETGFHPVKDRYGKQMGTIYIDHSGELADP